MLLYYFSAVAVIKSENELFIWFHVVVVWWSWHTSLLIWIQIFKHSNIQKLNGSRRIKFGKITVPPLPNFEGTWITPPFPGDNHVPYRLCQFRDVPRQSSNEQWSSTQYFLLFAEGQSKPKVSAWLSSQPVSQQHSHLPADTPVGILSGTGPEVLVRRIFVVARITNMKFVQAVKLVGLCLCLGVVCTGAQNLRPRMLGDCIVDGEKCGDGGKKSCCDGLNCVAKLSKKGGPKLCLKPGLGVKTVNNQCVAGGKKCHRTKECCSGRCVYTETDKKVESICRDVASNPWTLIQLWVVLVKPLLCHYRNLAVTYIWRYSLTVTLLQVWSDLQTWSWFVFTFDCFTWFCCVIIVM